MDTVSYRSAAKIIPHHLLHGRQLAFFRITGGSIIVVLILTKAPDCPASVCTFFLYGFLVTKKAADIAKWVYSKVRISPSKRLSFERFGYSMIVYDTFESVTPHTKVELYDGESELFFFWFKTSSLKPLSKG